MKKYMSTTIDVRVWEGIHKRAKEENRPLSNLVETVLSDYLDKVERNERHEGK